MSRLWLIFFVALFLAMIIDSRDGNLRDNGCDRQERFITCLLTVALILFCGLRIKGNDTTTYLFMYRNVPLWHEYWAKTNYTFADGIGFGVVTSLLKTWGFSEQNYLMFYATVTLIPYVMFVRRHSQSMLFGVFLMFATGFYLFSLAAIKQCVATGICLLAVEQALDKKWLRYLLLMVAAITFHPYALVYFLVPVLMFRPWTLLTFIYLVVFGLLGIYLDSLLGTVLDITDMMGATYTDDEFTGEGVNLFRVLVCFVPMALAALYGKDLFRDSTRSENLMFNMAMMNALIMFVGLFGTANYFARLANYFLPAQVVVLPWILNKTHPVDRQWMKPACVTGYMGYFLYENLIARPFNYYYKHMSLWDYIATLF